MEAGSAERVNGDEERERERRDCRPVDRVVELDVVEE